MNTTSFKQAIYKLVQKGSHGKKGYRFFDYFIMALILISILVMIAESFNELPQLVRRSFIYFNYASITVFTIEYLMRLYVADLTHPAENKSRSIANLIFSTYGLIDLLAILPFYLPMLIKIDLRFLRILRLVRFLRVLKINRYNNSIQLIWDVIREKKTELYITLFVTFLVLLLASFIMYYVEGPAQPDQFPNILASFWWAVATLTTVGYGDVYPITGIGKFISGVIALVGIGIIALPTGIISSGFMDKIEKNKTGDKCPHCGK